MRYAQGGGLTPQGQAARERVRMPAVDGFARGKKNTVIAKELRVSVRSGERWRRCWRTGGRGALCTSGPAKRPKIGVSDFAVLEPLLVGDALPVDERPV